MTALPCCLRCSAGFSLTPQRERKRERVHLGILRLSGADLPAIEGWTQLACDDFRDLLIEAEYRLSLGKDRLKTTNPRKHEALEQKEREQYDAWIAKVLAP